MPNTPLPRTLFPYPGQPQQGAPASLDIPPRTRQVLIVLALAGMICAVIGSLMTTGRNVRADKVVHFGGYSMLGALMILGLRPRLWLPGAIMVVALSGTLELIQPYFGRKTDWRGDFVVNVYAVLAGASLGLIARFVWSYVRTEALNAEIREAIVVVPDGSIIFQQGEPSTCLYIIRRGAVSLTRESGGREFPIGEAKAGEVVGEMGVLQKLPRYATARARGECSLYCMSREELLEPREDGQIHPAAIVARVLAQRLRAMNEQFEVLRSNGSANRGPTG